MIFIPSSFSEDTHPFHLEGSKASHNQPPASQNDHIDLLQRAEEHFRFPCCLFDNSFFLTANVELSRGTLATLTSSDWFYLHFSVCGHRNILGWSENDKLIPIRFLTVAGDKQTVVIVECEMKLTIGVLKLSFSDSLSYKM